MCQVTENVGNLDKSKKTSALWSDVAENLERQQSVTWAKSETDSK